MAYTVTESPVDYDTTQKYIRYRGLRKGSARNDYDAQVALHDVNYGTALEQIASRYKDLRQPTYPERPPLLPTTQVPPVAYVEQRSSSKDRGKDNRRMGNIGYERLNDAQQEAYRQLAGRTDQLQDASEAGTNEERHRKQNVDEGYEEGIRWNPAEIYDEYAVHQQSSEEIATNPAHEEIHKDKPISYGLPSNPRPDPHRRNPSIETSAILGSHRRNVSIATNGKPDPHQRNPSIGRNSLPDPHRRHPSIERNEISPAHKEAAPYRSQDFYRSNEVADTYQRRPSDQERKGSSHSREGGSDSWKGSTDSRKGSSTSHTREDSQTLTRPLVALAQPSFSDMSRSRSKGATRKVKVTCDQTSFTLSLTPTTTAKDVLSMARDCLGEGFDQKRYIPVESYRQLGLERPLRHFERISDVLDTWDTDDKDSLLIQPLHAQWEHESLDLENAPKLVPSNMTAILYYSHRPESWHKWSFTLRVDGQIVMQKYSGGDFKAICHMNDFDIYIPTSRQMKKLAPPRKFCFAIKSQQKSISSSDQSSFVHFFSTNDKDAAAEWYRAVHSWRSYHITHNKRIGQTSSLPFSKPSYSADPPRRNASLPESTMHKDSMNKPLPKLNQAMVSTTNDEYKPFGVRGDAFVANTKPFNPYHNRSASADRYGTSRWNHPQHPIVSTEPSVIRSLPERSHTMRKQHSEPTPFAARAIVHPDSYGKPSVDLTRERKLSDDLESDSHDTAGHSRQPYQTGSNTFDKQRNASHSTQSHARGDEYGGAEPMDRKFSYEVSVDGSYARDYYGSISEAANRDAHIPSIQAEKNHEITTRTGERFF
ncbi:MAG: hypothetical protein GOMPHAMPRED_006989 [Gomphillus americanus]|uniref:PH domain-containing protein n=1 Tax=Gomphillus americanus TaxID=1940652 RepID=A0A8H3ER98_9LECA|nr:MAG: hypothetical protein GOMPHAMPRED_006989 [Gomphillus americanus]